MQNDKIKNYLHLHFIVFVWGFTAVLGALITIDALPLVWYRMLIACSILFLVTRITKKRAKLTFKSYMALGGAGCVIALHWITFFEAIKASNVSVTLVCISTGAFFASILEPIFYKRRFVLYEIVFGVITIIGVYLIFDVAARYITGIILALISAFLSALFSIINGKFVQKYQPATISLVELSSGVLFITPVLLFRGKLNPEVLHLTYRDLVLLFVLGSVCTAYAFMSSVKVMRFLSPYTVMLTINLEPVYGILLAFLILPDSEQMSYQFYIGAAVILVTVLLNGILKNRKKRKYIA